VIQRSSLSDVRASLAAFGVHEVVRMCRCDVSNISFVISASNPRHIVETLERFHRYPKAPTRENDVSACLFSEYQDLYHSFCGGC